MRILIAPDSFKGSLSSSQFINIFANKIAELKVSANIIACPIADGGEGSLEVISETTGFEKIGMKAFNPYFNEIDAWYLYEKKTKTAYIEMAIASGLLLVDKADVMNASSYGTGQLMKHAIENHAVKIILFIGGSATNDAGTGIANALGVSFRDNEGKNLKPTGVNLTSIHLIDDTQSILKNYSTEIVIAADVNNPFYGINGAAYVYAPQKGACKNEIIDLDKGLRNISSIFKTKYSINVQNIKGSGAAGGIGGGLIAFFTAKIISGSDLIFKLTNIEKKIKSADLIITGEGKIDHQTINDKLIFKLSKLAAKHHKKIWAVCGYYNGDDELKKLLGIEKIFSLAKSKKDIISAIENAESRLSGTITEVMESILKYRF